MHFISHLLVLLFFLLSFFLSFFGGVISFFKPPPAHSVADAGLKLKITPASTCRVLGVGVPLLPQLGAYSFPVFILPIVFGTPQRPWFPKASMNSRSIRYLQSETSGNRVCLSLKSLPCWQTSASSRPAWSTQRVPGKPGLHRLMVASLINSSDSHNSLMR